MAVSGLNYPRHLQIPVLMQILTALLLALMLSLSTINQSLTVAKHLKAWTIEASDTDGINSSSTEDTPQILYPDLSLSLIFKRVCFHCQHLIFISSAPNRNQHIRAPPA